MTDAEPDGPDGDSVDQPDEPSVDDAGVIAFEPPVEPGTPSLENALFVLLGVGLALGVVLRLVELFG